MQLFRKKITSFIAALMAVLTVLPLEKADAIAGINTDNSGTDSGVYWSSELPTEGDKSYKSDKYWHRLILEYGDYCTNSEDSEGNYVDISSETGNSWPDYRFHMNEVWDYNKKQPSDEERKQYSEGWIGDPEVEKVTKGTARKESDYSLYKNNEYTMDGMHSLYIKYAGLSKNKEPCYYISPCDQYGNREEKLWALDCCLDLCVGIRDYKSKQFNSQMQFWTYNSWTATGIVPVSDGINPVFTLLTPTYEQFETLDMFKYAGVTTSNYEYREEKTYVKNQVGNNGTMKAEYTDNNKWIITQNEDGSWAVKSAGHIEWDWSDSKGDFDLMFGDNLVGNMEMALTYYAIACCFCMDVAAGTKRADSGKEYGIIERYAVAPWAASTWMYFKWLTPAMHLMPMLWLNEYVENVYILGNFYARGTTFFNTQPITTANTDGKLNTGYVVEMKCNYDISTYSGLLTYLIEGAYNAGSVIYKDWYSRRATDIPDCWEIKAASYDSDGKVARYATVDELQSKVKLDFHSCFKPDKNTGAFSGLYVGTALKTETYDPSCAKVYIENGVTQVLGSSDKNGDGACDGITFIGTPAAKNASATGDMSNYGPTVVVESGARLQIDGPTYAALGTKLVVKGSLYISPGAFLGVEDLGGTSMAGSQYEGLNLQIDGGSVYISNGAILDLDYGELEIKNNGSLVNKGVCVQGTLKKSSRSAGFVINDGLIENGAACWFIAGADVKNNQRMTLVRNVMANPSLDNLANYISDVYDYSLHEYKSTPFENGGDNQFEAVDVKMLNSADASNYFRNLGYSFISGSIKGEKKDKNYLVGQGVLYRAKDIYAGNISVSGSSLDNHEINCPDKSQVNTAELLVKYYALTNINSTASFVDDEAETTCMKKNLLALRVGTGSTGTDSISGFEISYIGKDGKSHLEVVDPSTLENTYKYVRDCTFCGDAEDEKGDSDLRSHGGTNDILSAQSFPTSLEPYSNNVYLLEAMFPVSYIESISFAGSATGAWSCTELSLYRVKYLSPLKEYGWCSENWYVPFEGTLLAEVPLSKNSSGINGQTFTFGAENIEFGTGLRRLNVYEVPKAGMTRTDETTGFVYYSASQEKVSYTTKEESFVFSISLADTSNAGIESLYNVASDVSMTKLMSDSAWVDSIQHKTGIDMLITYLDTQGSLKIATLPFTMSAVEWAYSGLNPEDRSNSIHGLFQQGEEIAFQGVLPDLQQVFEVYVTYTDADTNGTIAIAAVSLNKPNYIGVSVTDGKLKYDYPDSALSFYCAPDSGGVYLNCNQTMNVTMKTWNGTEALRPKTKGSQYLVVVETDKMSDAATVNDLSVSFTYKTLAGVAVTTSTYSVRSVVNDYYGYWLSAEGLQDDCAYNRGVSAGGQLYFVLDLDNLYKFTSATFTMSGKAYVEPISTAEATTGENNEEEPKTAGVTADPSAGNAESEESANGATYPGYASSGRDEWQMSAITIYELSELGERSVTLNPTGVLEGTDTNRTYYRVNRYGSRGAINSGKGPLMISPGQSKTISFESGGSISGGGEVTSKNKATKIKNLSYEETKQDFGFNSKRVKYNVIVKVKGDSITSIKDGDCGSKNQFYFQLVFQDEAGELHQSPCVLSNQQLKSDGFRTGTEEEFAIYTNDDYGTPVQINIIPDDTSSISDVFDKLCIEKITVSKTSSAGVNLSWETGEVGWIDIEYKDDSEEQDGRSDDELIRSFELKDGGYKVWVEFGIETAAEYVDTKQFVGQVTADITYRDSTGAVKTRPTVAVVGRIADYAERMSEVSSAKEGTEISVPAYMFRKGYTNRFLVEFNDISSLVSIKLTLTPEEDTALKINKVFARQVYNEGTLSLNVFNEYEHHYSITPNDLATSTNTGAVTIDPKGTSAALTLFFSSGNFINVDLTEGEESVNVQEGEKEGANDVLSLTAKLKGSDTVDAAATMSARIVYKNIYGDAYAVTSTLVYDSVNNLFIIPTGDFPSTPYVSMPYQVEITGGAMTGREIEKVTVNQERDGKLIHDFDFVPAEGTLLAADVPVTITIPESDQDSYAEKMGYTSDVQQVFVKLGSLTQKSLLSASQDLKLALVYEEKDDPYKYEHVSEYVSAFDQGYTLIGSGSLMSITLKTENVGRVKAIRLMTTDAAMRVNAEKGCVAVKHLSNLSGNAISTGWVNLPATTALVSTAGSDMNSDGQSLSDALSSTSRITPITFSTQLSRINRSDAIVKVSMVYLNSVGMTQTVSSEIAASELNYNDISFLAEGLKTPQYYSIEVYDKDTTNTAGVTISSMVVSWYDGSGNLTSSSYTGSMALTEGAPGVNALVTSQLTGTISDSTGTTKKIEDNLVTTGRTGFDSISVKSGGALYVSATLPVFTGELYFTLTDENGNLIQRADAGGTDTSLVATMTAPNNSGSENTHYTLTIRARNLSELYSAKLNVEVEPAPTIEYLPPIKNDGTPTGASKTISYSVSDYVLQLHGGDTVTIYARAKANDALSISPTADDTLTVSTASNISLAGYEGTWTKYTVTIKDVSGITASTVKIKSLNDPNLAYEVRLTIEPTSS